MAGKRQRPPIKAISYPDGKEPKYPICPICGAETDTFYRNRDLDIIGCGECVSTVDAWDHYDFEENA